MNSEMVEAYLERIGAARPARADLGALRELQERHVRAVPFENISYHMAEPVHMDERVVDKIVRKRRGGGCYETNPAFALLLRELGFTVHVLPGRVFRPDGLGPPLAHLALRVDLEDRWLVDTGFGRNSLHPLRLDQRRPQADPHGEYLLSDAGDGWVDVSLNGTPLYRIDDRPVAVADFGPTLWWYRTAADSPFLQDLFCSLPTANGRVTIKGNRLTTVVDGERTVENLPDDDAVLAAYRKWFGIELDRVPSPPSSDGAGIQLP